MQVPPPPYFVLRGVDLCVRTRWRFAEIEGRRALEVESKRKGDRPLTFSARRDRVRFVRHRCRAVVNRDWVLLNRSCIVDVKIIAFQFFSQESTAARKVDHTAVSESQRRRWIQAGSADF